MLWYSWRRAKGRSVPEPRPQYSQRFTRFPPRHFRAKISDSATWSRSSCPRCACVVPPPRRWAPTRPERRRPLSEWRRRLRVLLQTRARSEGEALSRENRRGTCYESRTWRSKCAPPPKRLRFLAVLCFDPHVPSTERVLGRCSRECPPPSLRARVPRERGFGAALRPANGISRDEARGPGRRW